MTASNFPGYNCKQCGYNTCIDLLKATKRNITESDKCPFKKETKVVSADNLIGVIDGIRADFRLKPLKGEPSCRERLLPLTPGDIKVGSFIKYRPIGCPVAHFAKIIDYTDGLITVHLIGPRAVKKYKNIGLCMVIGFEGIVDGKVPKMCQTVKFIPHGCMMQKNHSAVVTSVEGKKIKVEGIHLAVWEHAK